MLNWDKSAIFSRVFPIFDKVHADNWDFKNMLDRRRAFTQKGEWVSHELPEATLDFYPESGNLVNGIESKVAYELRGEDGLFAEESIDIFDGEHKLLTTTPVHMGKGTFTITPRSDAKYRAEVTLTNSKGKKKKHTFRLPAAAPQGAVMSVTEDEDSIKINITSNIEENTEMGFVILHRGTMGFYKKLNTASLVGCHSFAKSQLREGVCRAVLFVGNNTPLAERQFFVMHDTLQQSDIGIVRLNVTANGNNALDESYTTNQKITLKVSREDGKPLPDNCDLSLTVSDAIANQKTSYSHNLYSYMLLGSELKGYIPNAARYFDPGNKERKKQLDLLMLTHGWTSYDWQLLTRPEIKEMQPIERGITLKGTFIQRTLSRKFGHYGETTITPQAYNLIRLDVANNDKQIEMSTFRTDSVGEFIIGFDEFYGTRVASLKPQTLFKKNKNISYHFALDRYYSPEFRLYDYWERHLGMPMSKHEADSFVKINPFEFLLSSVEVSAKKKVELNSRPPRSEMRFNFLDEWEYAQDVTFLNMFEKDYIYELIVNDELNYGGSENEYDKNFEQGKRYDEFYYGENYVTIGKKGQSVKYIGNIRYGEDTPGELIDHEYDHVLTVADVVKSAIYRHNYYWAYWVQLMVVDGDYNSKSVPKVDMEYLRGVPDVNKMTNFKEFVIRSDKGARELFVNSPTHWEPLGRMLDNKVPLRKFYEGFLSQLYIFPNNNFDGCPDIHSFKNHLLENYPTNPNYVACMIPYTEEENTSEGIIPDISAPGTLRYTSVQGYSESKKFYSPDYSAMKPTEPDYRRTLLWVPEVKIENGEALIEFYNSNNCKNITVSVDGRSAHTTYSNEELFTTRTYNGERVANSNEKSKRESDNSSDIKNDYKYINVAMDSTLRAQCAWEHEKGVIYYKQKHYKKAVMVFAELVQYKYAPSMYYIALCYENGTGLNKNTLLASKFLLEAAKHGEPMAQHDLAHKLTLNETPEDSIHAHAWFRRAALQGEPRALLEMSKRYRKGLMVEKDETIADKYLTESAQKQHPEALFEYGKRRIEQGKEGVRYIEAAANNKSEAALLYMLEYEHKKNNYKAAYSYARELSLLGNQYGTKRMADYYYEGKGVARDKSLAIDLYRNAAAKGNKEAKEALKDLR